MSDAVRFSRKSASRIAAATRKVEAMAPPLREGPGTGRAREPRLGGRFWAEVTGGSVGAYTWKLMYPDATGDLVAADPAVTGSGLYEANGSHLETGQRVEATFAGLDGSSNPLYVCAAAMGMFPVTLTQTGGSNGNKTTAASWTYTAASLSGETLGTSLSPQWPRPNGTMTAATAGLAYYDSGSVVLAIAFEQPGSGGCA